MSHDAQISAERRPGYLLIKLPSVVSMDNYIDVEKDIDALLTGKNDRIVLDLTDTSNIYSSGMGLMIRLNKKVAASSGQMCLVNVSDRCRRILVSVHLDKVLPMYATDVEFEVSQEEVWKRKSAEESSRLVVERREEGDIMRISVSGQLLGQLDLADLQKPMSSPSIKNYIFDLTGLDAVDSGGVGIFTGVLAGLSSAGGKVAGFGASPEVREMLTMLGLDRSLPCYEDEKLALEAAAKA